MDSWIHVGELQQPIFLYCDKGTLINDASQISGQKVLYFLMDGHNNFMSHLVLMNPDALLFCDIEQIVT